MQEPQISAGLEKCHICFKDIHVFVLAGLISVVGQLDYESQPRYELVIRASDVNSASYTDTHVYIYLEV